MALNARPSARTSDGPATGIGRSKRPVWSLRADSARRRTGREIQWLATSERTAPTRTNQAPRMNRSARRRSAGASASS